MCAERKTHSLPLTLRMVFSVSFILFALLPLQVGLAQSAFDLGGDPFDPLKSANGKITVLIFVRTDCPISNRYAPLLQHLYDSYSAKAKFWLVYPDKKTTSAEVSAHGKQYQYTIPALRDPGHFLVNLASATITPEAAVFDGAGRLLYHGRIDNWYESPARSRPIATTHELRAAVDAAIARRPVSAATAPAIGCYISDLE